MSIVTDDVGPLRLAAVTRKRGAASFEQRIGASAALLARRGIGVEVIDLPDRQLQQGRLLRRLESFDGVWWQRHLLAPWWLGRLRAIDRPVVFDYDDPLWLSSDGGGRPSLSRRVRFAGMLRSVDAVTTASEHLAAAARRRLPHDAVHVVPMPVDLPPAPLPHRPEKPLTLVWIGSAATQPYLDLIRTTLERVGQMRPGLRLRVVSHAPVTSHFVKVEWRRWSEAEQAAALREGHVGLCPMPDTPWTRGKVPYKVLQYMAHAMPWVGSAVGELMALSGDGRRGVIARDSKAWVEAIVRLLDDPAARQAMGEAGRAHIEQHHARQRVVERIVILWKRFIEREPA